MCKVKNIILLGATLLAFNTLLAQNSIGQSNSNNWYYLSPTDSVKGIDLIGAYDAVKNITQRPKTVTVAILDTGMDIDHEDLKTQIFKKTKEKQDGIDNDKNGYIDDVSGWNFLGSSNDTLNVESVGTIFFREFKRLYPKYEHLNDGEYKSLSESDKAEYTYFQTMRKKAGIGSYLQFFEYLKSFTSAYVNIDSLMAIQYPNKATTIDDFRKLTTDSISSLSFDIVNSRTFMLDSTVQWRLVLDEKLSEYLVAEKRVRSLGETSSPRDLIKDNPNDINDIYYGNKNLKVDMDHATFVAGIVAATRDNGLGIDGITNNVRIMPIRVVPNGDEYDKDVAVGIKYAVDNGAQIINMSFGKYLSPHSKWVEEAIKYATDKNVLMVHASGNDGYNIDSIPIFPSRYMPNQKESDTFIRVGATDEKGVPISISNFGKKEVDLFAPGYNINSLSGNNGYMRSQGTSIAAPMVTGVAALIWSYYPKLTAVQIKKIILESVTKTDNMVNLPGKSNNPQIIKFSELSRSGGILNARESLLKAAR